MRRIPKPIIAMVAGYAIGGGHILHLVCDISIAADNARFGQTGPKVGSFDGGYGSSILARTIGLKRAKEVWFLCRQYDAAQALDWGLVNTVVPLDDLERETVAWCRQMLTLSPDRVAHDQGGHERGRRRPGRRAAAGRRRHHALLHDRGGAGGPQRLRGAPSSGLLALPAPPVSPPLKLWVAGARPRTLPAADRPGRGRARRRATSRAGASSSPHRRSPARATPRLCATFDRQLSWLNAVLALIVALGIQIGTNYVNDYADGVRGTDEHRVGPVRLVAGKLATVREVKIAALIAFGIAGLAGLGLAARVTWWFIPLGLVCGIAGWAYTGGPRPYGYLGFGELFVFVFFGLVATAGSAYVQHAPFVVSLAGHLFAYRYDWWFVLWAGVPVGLLAAALLQANNLRDIATDTESGKKTLAVRLGRRRAGLLYCFTLMGVALSIGIVLAATGRGRCWRSLATAGGHRPAPAGAERRRGAGAAARCWGRPHASRSSPARSSRSDCSCEAAVRSTRLRRGPARPSSSQ